MTEIQEIPIEAEDISENTQEMLTSIPETCEEIQPAPKKRGRPAGAKNKAAPKPKPKAKKRKPVEYEEYEEESEEEEIPRRRVSRGRVEQPVSISGERELDRHALASEVLGILQEQRYQRTSARRNHYASWFENLS